MKLRFVKFNRAKYKRKRGNQHVGKNAYQCVSMLLIGNIAIFQAHLFMNVQINVKHAITPMNRNTKEEKEVEFNIDKDHIALLFRQSYFNKMLTK